jgi:hypothetical protein
MGLCIPLDFESSASANFATPANQISILVIAFFLSYQNIDNFLLYLKQKYFILKFRDYTKDFSPKMAKEQGKYQQEQLLS